jgi:hypothetical protein
VGLIAALELPIVAFWYLSQQFCIIMLILFQSKASTLNSTFTNRHELPHNIA